MTPADLTLIRALIRDVRAHFDGRGISGPMALRLADACEMLMREREPLTDDEIKRLAGTPAAIPGTFIHAIVRAVERHHRIESESK